MSENEDPSIQRGPTGSRADKKSTPSSRQSAQNEARELGIDPRGMSTREIKDVVKAEKDEQAEMRNFVTKTMDAAGWKPPTPPQVTAPAITSFATVDPALPPPPEKIPPPPRPKNIGPAESDYIGDIIQWDRFIWYKCNIEPTQGCLLYFDEAAEKWAVLDKPEESEVLGKKLLACEPESEHPFWADGLPDGGSDGDILQWNTEVAATDASEGVPAEEGVDPGWKTAGIHPQNNEMLFYNAATKKWSVLAAPPSTGTHVLGCVTDVLTWMATFECEEEVPPPY